MAHISQKVILKAAADDVWRLVGDFAALDQWHRYVKAYPVSGEGVGAVRTLTIGGRVIPETLAAVDDADRSFTYTIPDDAPTPYENYRSTLRVDDLGDGTSAFIWTIDCDPTDLPAAEVVSMLSGFVAVGLNGLARQFGDAGT